MGNNSAKISEVKQVHNSPTLMHLPLPDLNCVRAN